MPGACYLRGPCRSGVIYNRAVTGDVWKPRYLRGRAEAALSTTYVMYWCRWPSAGVAAIDIGHMKDDETPSVKKQKGSNGYPKGVSETGRKTIRFQARVGYKPSPDGKTVQRSAGTFDTPEEAALQVAAYEAKLAEGIDPWNGEQVRSQHGRGQVRSQLPLSNVLLSFKAPGCRHRGQSRRLRGARMTRRPANPTSTVQMATRLRPQARSRRRSTRSCCRPSTT